MLFCGQSYRRIKRTKFAHFSFRLCLVSTKYVNFMLELKFINVGYSRTCIVEILQNYSRLKKYKSRLEMLVVGVFLIGKQCDCNGINVAICQYKVEPKNKSPKKKITLCNSVECLLSVIFTLLLLYYYYTIIIFLKHDIFNMTNNSTEILCSTFIFILNLSTRPVFPFAQKLVGQAILYKLVIF